MPTDSLAYVPDVSLPSGSIAELWKEVLQLAELPVGTDNFFALGGDSMSMVMLTARISEDIGIDIPDDAVLGAQTLHEMTILIDAELKAQRKGVAKNAEISGALSGGEIASGKAGST